MECLPPFLGMIRQPKAPPFGRLGSLEQPPMWIRPHQGERIPHSRRREAGVGASLPPVIPPLWGGPGWGLLLWLRAHFPMPPEGSAASPPQMLLQLLPPGFAVSLSHFSLSLSSCSYVRPPLAVSLLSLSFPFFSHFPLSLIHFSSIFTHFSAVPPILLLK